MMAGVVAFVLLALLAFGLAWVGSWDRGPNPRQTLTADERRRVEAMKDAEGEALDPYHVCGHCASPPWSESWVHDECRPTCCSGGGL